MVTSAYEKALAKRSLATIRTELQFLRESDVITGQQLEVILNELPPDSNSTTTSAFAQARAAENHNASTSSLASKLNSTHINEKQQQSSFYGQPTPSPNAPPPAYPVAPAVPSALCNATALYQYNAQDAGDLQLAPNDQIEVTEYMNAEWWKGRNKKTGQEGIFPRSYVKVDEKAMQAPQSNYGNVPLDVSQSGGGAGPAKDPSQGQEMGKKFGKKLGNAAIFGAGATVGSKIVNGIF